MCSCSRQQRVPLAQIRPEWIACPAALPPPPPLSHLRPALAPLAIALVLLLVPVRLPLSSILLVRSVFPETKIAINAFTLLRGAEYERCRCRCRVSSSAAGAGAGAGAGALGHAEPLTCFDVGLTNTELQVCLHCSCVFSCELAPGRRDAWALIAVHMYGELDVRVQCFSASRPLPLPLHWVEQ